MLNPSSPRRIHPLGMALTIALAMSAVGCEPKPAADSNSGAKESETQPGKGDSQEPVAPKSDDTEPGAPNPSSTSTGQPPAGDAAELTKRLTRDRERIASSPEEELDPDLKVEELQAWGREFFNAAAAGDESKVTSYFLSDDQINAYYQATQAQIMNMSRSAKNYTAWKEFQALVGGQPAKFLAARSPGAVIAPVGALFKKSTRTAKVVTVDFLLTGVPHTIDLKTVVQTEAGWKCLQIELDPAR